MFDHINDTLDHKVKVADLMIKASSNLQRRAVVHDFSKFSELEFNSFVSVNNELKDIEYGTGEYKRQINKLGPAIEHHYIQNSHHPEHYENGIRDMSMFDIIEMICDWKAASERTKNGDFLNSLKINKERFDLSEELYYIIEKTAMELFGSEYDLTEVQND